MLACPRSSFLTSCLRPHISNCSTGRLSIACWMDTAGTENVSFQTGSKVCLITCMSRIRRFQS